MARKLIRKSTVEGDRQRLAEAGRKLRMAKAREARDSEGYGANNDKEAQAAAIRMKDEEGIPYK